MKIERGAGFTLNGRDYVITMAGRVNIKYKTANTDEATTQYFATRRTALDNFVTAGLITPPAGKNLP